MNAEKLRDQEARFFDCYPEGFQNPEMVEIAKRHDSSKLIKLIREELGPQAFDEPDKALAAIGKLITRSSLVSVFEKTAFKNYLNALPAIERADLAEGFRELLHGNQEAGFESLVALMAPYKMAKWPVITSVLYYADPFGEIAVKPTTVKGVIDFFELEGLNYVTRPTYAFYKAYLDRFLEMKALCCDGLQVENAAFSGFLMFSMGKFL